MKALIESIYWFCADFTINAANMLGLTYFEFNFYVFILFLPALTIVLLIVNAILSFKMNKVKKSKYIPERAEVS